MSFEIEMKFPVPSGFAPISEFLREIHAYDRGTLAQVDLYFRHPVRDFAQTDEALRLRKSGDEVFITYKGPRHGHATKTRTELEPQLQGPNAFDVTKCLLEQLGFEPVREVKKWRRTFQFEFDSLPVTVCFDQVEPLGDFVEIEVTADREGVPHAQQVVLDLAARLNLKNSERRSYLAMILEAAASP